MAEDDLQLLLTGQENLKDENHPSGRAYALAAIRHSDRLCTMRRMNALLLSLLLAALLLPISAFSGFAAGSQAAFADTDDTDESAPGQQFQLEVTIQNAPQWFNLPTSAGSMTESCDCGVGLVA
ncbi:MAG: hypothetical protein LBR39_06985 [Coriobacteriales bacterium]|jgi:hypothetical protein|nr:hypothetical protein [Coriobacteriales bacterium]